GRSTSRRSGTWSTGTSSHRTCRSGLRRRRFGCRGREDLFVGKSGHTGVGGVAPTYESDVAGVGGVAPTYGVAGVGDLNRARYSWAATASMTRAEYTSAAPALSATATPSASAISSRVAPCFSAASTCTVMQPSQRVVTATA